jgi:uncharacterized protein YaaN involved in tellurite resistance
MKNVVKVSISLFTLLSEVIFFFYYHCHHNLISACGTPENLGQAVVDLQLREKEEENKTISEQLKRMIVEGEKMTKHIHDLELRLEAANQEAVSLKMSNFELERKVCSSCNTFF